MYVISYDISSDRLRNHISKKLEGYGRRVQYSVFECEIREKQLKKLYGELMLLMSEAEETEGDICIYSLCGRCEGKKIRLGNAQNVHERLSSNEPVIVV